MVGFVVCRYAGLKWPIEDIGAPSAAQPFLHAFELLKKPAGIPREMHRPSAVIRWSSSFLG